MRQLERIFQIAKTIAPPFDVQHVRPVQKPIQDRPAPVPQRDMPACASAGLRFCKALGLAAAVAIIVVALMP